MKKSILAAGLITCSLAVSAQITIDNEVFKGKIKSIEYTEAIVGIEGNNIIYTTSIQFNSMGKPSSWSTDKNMIDQTGEIKYDDHGHKIGVIELSPGMGIETRNESWKYDAKHRLVSSSRSNSSETIYTYDENGNIIKESNGSWTYTYTYNKKGQLTQKETKDVENIQLANTVYTYDKNGKCIAETSKSTKHNDDVKGYTIKTKYDASGRVTEVLEFNEKGEESWKTTTAYDKSGNISSNSSKSVAGNKTFISTYEYDSTGNWIKKTTTVDGKPSKVETRFITYA